MSVVGIAAVYQSLLEVARYFPELQVSVSSAVRAGCITGGSAIAGSLVAGRKGVLVGAVVGGVVAYAFGGSYRPALQVLMDMTDAEKEKLRDAVLRAARDRGIWLLTAAAWKLLPLDDLKQYLKAGLKIAGYTLK